MVPPPWTRSCPPLLIASPRPPSSAALCVLLRPLLLRYALARPNARSSHTIPTPQGGGIAVLAGCFLRAVALALAPDGDAGPGRSPSSCWRRGLLALVGAWDDIRPLPASIRLGAAGALRRAGAGLCRTRPAAVSRADAARGRARAGAAGRGLVRQPVNFMDGLDWITVAGIVPLAGALALARRLRPVRSRAPPGSRPALCGGLIGFAPFNRPVAQALPRRCRLAADRPAHRLSAVSAGRRRARSRRR